MLVKIRAARARIQAGDRKGDAMIFPLDAYARRLSSQVFTAWYNDLDLTRFQIYATEAVDAMPPDVRARFTRNYPPADQPQIES